jgi:hypothetical protein
MSFQRANRSGSSHQSEEDAASMIQVRSISSLTKAPLGIAVALSAFVLLVSAGRGLPISADAAPLPIAIYSCETTGNSWGIWLYSSEVLDSDQITVQTIVMAGPAPDDAKTCTWLAGLASAPDTPSSVVALSVVDGGGRYSAPVLRLESTHELLSADLDAKTETHWFGEVQYIELKRISFVRGHTYRAELSYDRLRGEVSVSLFDLTTDRSIYSGFLYVNEYLGPLNAMAGEYRYPAGATDAAGIAAGRSVAVESMQISYGYQRLGVADVLRRTSLDLDLRRSFWGEELSVRLGGIRGVKGLLPGILRCVAAPEDGGEARELFSIPASGLPTTVTIDGRSVPPGEYQAILQYVEPGSGGIGSEYVEEVCRKDWTVTDRQVTAELRVPLVSIPLLTGESDEITGGDVVLTSARDIDDQVTVELIAYPLDQAGGDSEPSTVLTETFNGLRARQTVVPFTCSTPGGWQPRRFRLTVSGATYRPIVVGRDWHGFVVVEDETADSSGTCGIAVIFDPMVHNPYDPNQIRVTTTFVSPSGLSIEIDGSLDREYELNGAGLPVRTPRSVWRSRFTPTEPGDWTYAVHVESAESGVVGSLLASGVVKIDSTLVQDDERRGVIAVEDSDPWTTSDPSPAREGLAPPRGNLAFPCDIAEWSAEAKESQRRAGYELLQSLRIAAEEGRNEFVIRPGDYRFGRSDGESIGPLVVFPQMRDMRIIANGVTFWMESWFSGLHIENSTNVVIEGLTIDWDPLPFTQGRITAVFERPGWGRSYIEFEVDPGFLTPDELLAAEHGLYTQESIPAIPVGVYESDTSQLKAWAWGKPSRILKVSERVYRVYVNLPAYPYPNTRVATSYSDYGIAAGDRFVMLYRDSNRSAVTVASSDNVQFHNVTLYSSPGIGFTDIGSYSSQGGTVLRGCKIVRRPGTGRLMSANADGFHCFFTKQGATVEGCEFAYNGDDAMNIRGAVSVVFGTTDDGSILVAPRSQMDLNLLLKPGVPITVFRGSDGAISGSATIAAVKPVADPALVEEARRADKEIGLQIWSFCGVYEASIDSPIEAGKHDFVTYGQDGGGFIVRGNYFHDNISRGIRLLSSNGVVVGNRIERTWYDPGLTVSLQLQWLEGSVSSNIIIRDNVFVDCNRALISKVIGHVLPFATIDIFIDPPLGQDQLLPGRVISNISIENNTIVRPRAAAILVANARDVRITDNRIVQPAYLEAESAGELLGIDGNYGIVNVNGKDVMIRGNVFEQVPPSFPGEVIDLSVDSH